MKILIGILALIGGVYFAGVEVIGVHEYLIAEQGGWTYVTLAGVGLAAVVSLLPACASLAWKGRKLLALGLWASFFVVLAIVIISGLTRTGSAVDTAQASREDAALARRLALADEKAARARLDTDQTNVDRECANVAKDKKGNPVGSAIGPKCLAASEARNASQVVLDKAVAALRGTKGATVDSLASRIAATGYITEAQFRTIWPLTIPVTTSLVSALLISLAVWLLGGEAKPATTAKTAETVAKPVEVVQPEPLPTPSTSVAHMNVVPMKRPAPKKQKAIPRQPAASLIKFVHTCTANADGSKVDLEDLFKAYRDFCAREDMTPLDPNSFVDDMRRLCNAMGAVIEGGDVLDMALTA
jgi:hypothetical protein